MESGLATKLLKNLPGMGEEPGAGRVSPTPAGGSLFLPLSGKQPGLGLRQVLFPDETEAGSAQPFQVLATSVLSLPSSKGASAPHLIGVPSPSLDAHLSSSSQRVAKQAAKKADLPYLPSGLPWVVLEPRQ